MSKLSYARGFCKCAQDHGVDPNVLASFAVKMANGAADTIREGLEGAEDRISGAMDSISDYADKNPILGGAALGASAPVASGAKSVGSVTAPIGAIAMSPLSVVTAPAGASVAASSGEDPLEGSAVGAMVPTVGGAALTGSVGSAAGGVAGSALSPVTAPVGASVGASAQAADEEFKKTVEKEKARFAERRKQMDERSRQRALGRIAAGK